MITKYALSYHTQAKVNDILDQFRFRHEEDAIEFISEYNDILAAKGYVSISALCDKLRIRISDDLRFNLKRIIFKDRMDGDNIYPYVGPDTGDNFTIVFPLYYELLEYKPWVKGE